MAAIALTDEQRAVATAPPGPSLVLAGPGTGKTAALTAHIAHLVRERGIGPASVLALTFSNRAAQELRARLAELLGDDGRAVDVATFHGFALRLVRQWRTALGYPPMPLRVCDGRVTQAILAETLSALGIGRTDLPLRHLARAIEQYRLAGVGGVHHAALQAISRAFEVRLRAHGAVDYPGMLLLAARLLRERPEVVRLCRLAYRAVLVDEAQDACALQYELVRPLAAHHRHLVLVGDPAQSLFAWRGADGTVLGAFLRDFPEATVRTLSQNFRSSPQIVAVANALGARLPVCLALQAVGPSGPPPIVHRAADDVAEAAFIAEEIVRLVRGGMLRHPGDAAVLIRANAQAPPIAGALCSRDLLDCASSAQSLGPVARPRGLADPAATTRHDSVRLLTIHAAKGLEWPVVFLPGLEEGVLPHRQALGAEDAREALMAERRVAYVAVSRPRLRLYLTYCRSRSHAGVSVPSQPSRFLEELADLPITRAA